MNIGIIVFPGTSSEEDMYYTIQDVLGEKAVLVDCNETSLARFDAVVLPGGSSYGDYVRPGACAAHAPIMAEVKRFASEGKPVLGISNGFQILLELHMLPGAMKQNESLKFICKQTSLIVTNNETMFTTLYEKNAIVQMPIAHGVGNYTCDEKTLNNLKENNQIVFTYVDEINGATEQIAGITNERGNVLGMMPYPERAVEKIVGSDDGLILFKSLVQNWRDSHVTQ